jgi:glycosyltransferase involved in cell wall biosynthesis
MAMTKILHFFKTYLPESPSGGIQQVIFQLAQGSASLGFEPHVLSLSAKGAARNERVGNHATHRSKLNLYIASTGLSWSGYRDFKELATEADLVHYHFPWPYMDALHFLAKINKPSIVSYHSDIVSQRFLLQFYKPLMHSFLGRVDQIVASSPNYAESSKVLTQFREKVSIIPYGIGRDSYPTPSATRLERWRSVLGSRFFLFVGALRYYKGLDFLLEAARRTQIPVVILGGGYLENELKEQATRLGLANVRFVGSLPDEDKCALLTLCEAFVFPSHLSSESFWISLLEAAMYGKPLISCEIGGGTTFINKAGQTGLVVRPGDPHELAEAMLTLWDNPTLGQWMGQMAAERFEALFTAKAMVKSYANLYEDILSSRGISSYRVKAN